MGDAWAMGDMAHVLPLFASDAVGEDGRVGQTAARATVRFSPAGTASADRPWLFRDAMP